MANFTGPTSRHSHYLEQFMNNVEEELIPFLRNIASGLRDELLKTNTVNSQRQRERKLRIVEELIRGELTSYIAYLEEQIEGLAEAEIEFNVGMFERLANLETEAPALEQVLASVYARPFDNVLLSEYFDDYPELQARKIRNAVSMGFAEGKTTQEIISEVVGTKDGNYTDGVLNVSRTSAERMVRTSLNHTANVARDSFYKENKDIIPYYEWVSTLDTRTSSVCQARDGQVYELGKGKLPPAHPNCRSTTAPLLEDDVEIDIDENGDRILRKKDQGGTRASMNGQVDSDLNYEDWMKMQSKEFQDDVLGEKRAALFRKGGLSLDKFVNDRGQRLTLDQLKKRFPTAWGKI